jgi:phage protein D
MFKLADGKIIFAKKGAPLGPTGRPRPVHNLKPVDVASWRMSEAERGGHRSVKCQWHDHDAEKRLTAPREAVSLSFGTSACIAPRRRPERRRRAS